MPRNFAMVNQESKIIEKIIGKIIKYTTDKNISITEERKQIIYDKVYAWGKVEKRNFDFSDEELSNKIGETVEKEKILENINEYIKTKNIIMTEEKKQKIWDDLYDWAKTQNFNFSDDDLLTKIQELNTQNINYEVENFGFSNGNGNTQPLDVKSSFQYPIRHGRTYKVAIAGGKRTRKNKKQKTKKRRARSHKRR